MRFRDLLLATSARGGGRALDPDVVALVAALRGQGSDMSPARMRTLDYFTRLEKAAGIRARTDDSWLTWAENDTQRRMSLQQRRLSTDVGTPVLDPENGTSFDGSTSAMDTGFIPSTHKVAMTGSDMRVEVVEVYNNVNTGVAAGCNSGTNSIIAIRPRSTGDFQANLNSAAFTLTGAVSDSRYMSAASRTPAGVFTGWANGVSMGTQAPANGTTLPSLSLYIGARHDSGGIAAGRACVISYVSIGASLTPAQEAAHAANLAILFSMMNLEYLSTPAQSPLAFAALGLNYAWHDYGDPLTLYRDEDMEDLVEGPGDPVRWVFDKSGNGNHAKATNMKMPPHFWTDGTRYGVKIGTFLSGGGLEIPSMDLSASDKVSGIVGFHRWDKLTVSQVLAIGGPVDATPVDFALSLRVGYGLPAAHRDLNMEMGPTASFKKAWPSLASEDANGNNDMVWEILHDRAANTAVRKAVARCNGLDPNEVDATGVDIPTGAFSSTSRVLIGIRPVTGGTFLSQELDAPIFQLVIGAGKQPRSIMSAVRNHIMPSARSATPGVQSLLIGAAS